MMIMIVKTLDLRCSPKSYKDREGKEGGEE